MNKNNQKYKDFDIDHIIPLGVNYKLDKFRDLSHVYPCSMHRSNKFGENLELRNKIIISNSYGLFENSKNIGKLFTQKVKTEVYISHRFNTLKEKTEEFKTFWSENINFFQNNLDGFDLSKFKDSFYFPNVDLVNISFPEPDNTVSISIFNKNCTYSKNILDEVVFSKLCEEKSPPCSEWRELYNVYRDYVDIIVDEYNEIRKQINFLRSLSKQIAYLFNLLKKTLRNLRQIFTKNHSFPFKNLDDYHSQSFMLHFTS